MEFLRQTRLVGLLVILLLLVACNDQQQSIESQNDAVADFDGLVSRLQAAGATVEVTGTVAQPFFATRPGNHC